jgi:hypothetical protein
MPLFDASTPFEARTPARVVDVRALLLVAALSAVLVTAGGALPAHAQGLGFDDTEIGLAYGVTFAGYGDALQRPHGLEGYLTVPVTSYLGLRVAAAHHTESRTLDLSPCRGGALLVEGPCANEPFTGDARWTTVGAGFAAHLTPFAGRVRPEAYGLVTATALDARFSSRTSDAEVRPDTPDDLAWGVTFGGGLSYQVSRLVGLSSRVEWQLPGLSACSPYRWSAFCERRLLPRVAVGAHLRLSALRRANGTAPA